MTVTVTLVEKDGPREAGRFLWDGVRIIVDPAREADRPLLMQMLQTPVIIDDETGVREVTATADPVTFLGALCRTYTGSYLRASRPE